MNRNVMVEVKMTKHKILQHLKRYWKECRLMVLLIVFVIIPVKSSIADWNWVPTGSMNPTILEGDLIYVNKVAYDLRLPLTLHRLAAWSAPKRGDIVVCFAPDDGTRLVKRVIAQPGDTIEMRNNVLLLNGEQLDYTKIDPRFTDYLSDITKKKSKFAMEYIDGSAHPVMSLPATTAMRNFGPVTIPQNDYFVMGDNRDNSRDSRYFGFVQREHIVGKATGLIVSFDINNKYLPRFKRFLSSLQ
jgi:signal peptidase I